MREAFRPTATLMAFYSTSKGTPRRVEDFMPREVTPTPRKKGMGPEVHAAFAAAVNCG